MDRVVIEDWKAFFGQWRESGLSQKEFCRVQGIGLFPVLLSPQTTGKGKSKKLKLRIRR
jgi:hypothetical protein